MTTLGERLVCQSSMFKQVHGASSITWLTKNLGLTWMLPCSGGFAVMGQAGSIRFTRTSKAKSLLLGMHFTQVCRSLYIAVLVFSSTCYKCQNLGESKMVDTFLWHEQFYCSYIKKKKILTFLKGWMAISLVWSAVCRFQKRKKTQQNSNLKHKQK